MALARAVERNIEHLRPWMSWVAEETRVRKEIIDRWEQLWMAGDGVFLGIFAADELEGNARILGSCGLHRRRGPGVLEIGYWVDKDHLRAGIGTETARLLTTAALAIEAVTSVEIHHDRANVASGRIPQRLGYAFMGETIHEASSPRQVGIDCSWSMTADRWPARLSPRSR